MTSPLRVRGTNLSHLDNIIGDLEDVDKRIDALKRERSRLNSQLVATVTPEVAKQLADKEYGCGTATIHSDLYRLKAVISKKVSYDQRMLAAVYDRIKASGENPSEYIKVKYDVSEAAYKNWPSVIQKEFEGAQTVEPSEPKFTYTLKEKAA